MTQQCGDILYIDDNEADIVVMRSLFSGNKYLRLTGVARDGEEGMAYLRREGAFSEAPRPCLILVDINMPRMNGFEFLQAIKAEPDLRHIPVVMLTGGTLERDVVRAYELGACSIITKPDDLDQFQEKMVAFEVYWSSISRLPMP